MAKYEIPDDLYYTREDEWVRLEKNRVTIGVTDYAQQQLGDIVFVELPAVGKAVDKGGEAAVVESVKAASEVYAPISGEVVEVNENLGKTPEVINTDPYQAGWICKIKISDKGELASLLDAEKYQALAA